MGIQEILHIKTKKEDTVQEIRTRLLYIILFLISALGLPALIVAAIEAYLLQQYATIVVYALFFVPIVFVTIFRKQLSYRLIVYIVIGFASFLAIGNIITYGFSGAGIPIFFTLFALTTLFLNQKAGLFIILISAIAVCVIGYLYITHKISLAIPLNEISTELISWITALSVLVLLGSIIVFSYSIVFSKMLQSIELARQRANDFSAINIQLKKDIQERIKTEQELRESEARFNGMIENLLEGFYSATPDGILLDYNKAFCNILGLNTNENHRGLKLPDFWQNPVDRQKYVEELQKTGIVKNYQVKAKKASGEKFEVEVNARIIRDEKNKPLRIEGTFKDVTEQKQIENELTKYKEQLEAMVVKRTKLLHEKTKKLQDSQQALLYLLEDVNESRNKLKMLNEQIKASNKELEAFAYSVSHDLRAPLRAINGFTGILMEDYVEKLDDEGKRLGDVIQKNAKKMGKLIDDLLAFSRLGRTSMQFSIIDMKNMVNSIYFEASNSAERKRIKFSVANLPEAYGDTNMMRQVWMNLISNAIKFSSKREKAVISITGVQEEEYTTYQISDNGVGFDMQYVNKIFGVFQRLHSDKEFPGTGVGLSLVQRIIHRHNGKIWVESELDKGTTFYFSLPIKIEI